MINSTKNSAAKIAPHFVIKRKRCRDILPMTAKLQSVQIINLINLITYKAYSNEKSAIVIFILLSTL